MWGIEGAGDRCRKGGEHLAEGCTVGSPRARAMRGVFIRHSLSTVKMLLRFYSVRYYRKVKRFEPILRHRICRLGKESRRKAC